MCHHSDRAERYRGEASRRTSAKCLDTIPRLRTGWVHIRDLHCSLQSHLKWKRKQFVLVNNNNGLTPRKTTGRYMFLFLARFESLSPPTNKLESRGFSIYNLTLQTKNLRDNTRRRREHSTSGFRPLLKIGPQCIQISSFLKCSYVLSKGKFTLATDGTVNISTAKGPF